VQFHPCPFLTTVSFLGFCLLPAVLVGPPLSPLRSLISRSRPTGLISWSCPRIPILFPSSVHHTCSYFFRSPFTITPHLAPSFDYLPLSLCRGVGLENATPKLYGSLPFREFVDCPHAQKILYPFPFPLRKRILDFPCIDGTRPSLDSRLLSSED